MAFSASSTVWRVRPAGGDRYRVEYCCRGGPAGAFDVLLTRALAPAVGAAELALCAAGVLLDRWLPLGAVLPAEVDLGTTAGADPAFLAELNGRLGLEAVTAGPPGA